MKIGMAAEATCVSKPWAVIPMVVTGVQDTLPRPVPRRRTADRRTAGSRPGTILVFLEPLTKAG